MIGLIRALEGLAVGHVCLLAFFGLGSAAFPWMQGPASAASAPRTMLRVTCTCALGIAIAGLGAFLLGSLGLLSPWILAAAFVGAIAAAGAMWRTPPWRAQYWAARASALRSCWNWPLAAVYLAALACGPLAVLPNAGVSDAVSYHLAYAQDWASAGRLVVDPFLRFPFFANNVALLFAAALAFKLAPFVNFLTWATGLLAALGVCAAIADEAHEGSLAAGAVAVLLALALLAAPVFLRWSVTGYVDVPLGTLALASVLCVTLAVRERSSAWLYCAAVVAGFLIGAKASLIVLLPVYALVFVWCRWVYATRRRLHALAVVAVLCATAAPWYLRNLALAGDPVPPVVNLALYGHDGLFLKSEWDSLQADLGMERSPQRLLTLPIRAFSAPASASFREYGATLLIVLAYLPAAVVMLALFLGKPLPRSLAVPFAFAAAMVAYWAATSPLLRYALLFYPLLAACVGLLLVRMLERWPKSAPLAVALAAATAVPSQGEVLQNYYVGVVRRDYGMVLREYRGNEWYLQRFEDGYVEAEETALWMKQRGLSGNVFVIGPPLQYYFRRWGIVSIGDWTGPAGYLRLIAALDEGRAAEFLRDLDARAVLVTPLGPIDAGAATLLARQLRSGGYRERALNGGGAYRLFVREEGWPQ